MKAGVRGVDLFFDVDGLSHRPGAAGKLVSRPTVVLVHGGPGSTHAAYKVGVASRLTDVAQLVYYDARGCGLSGGDPNASIEEDIADLEGLRTHLGLNRITILGTSYGGMVAIGYALAHPEHVAGLILACTAPSFHFLEEAQQYLARHGTEEQKRSGDKLFSATFTSTEDLGEFFEVMGPLYARDYRPGQAGDDWGIDRMSYQAVNLGFGGFLRTFDYVEDLHGITCPTLVLAGANDWICSPDQSRKIAERVPRAQLKVFTNSGHGLADDEPEAYLLSVQGFLTYLESST